MKNNKECTKCGKLKTIQEFYRDRTIITKEGYFAKCKTCCKLEQNERVKNTRDLSITNKICSICNVDLPISKFYKSYRHKDGYFKWCVECHEKKTKNKGNNQTIKRTRVYG